MTVLRRGTLGLAIATVALAGLAPAVHADNVESTADEVLSVRTVDLGDVCPGATKDGLAGFKLVRLGAVNNNTWGNDVVVTVSPDTQPRSAAGNLTLGSTSVKTPDNWTTFGNNALDAGTATVDLVVPEDAPVGPATTDLVGYTASGEGAQVAVNERSTKVAFTWTVLDCAPSDTTPPNVDYTLDPASPNGANDWYRTDVSIDWTVTDDESEFTVDDGCLDESFATDGVHEPSCTATSAGGTTGPVTATVKRDATAPEVSFTSGPEDGSSSYYGDQVPAAACEATDATSGVTDAGCTVTGGGTTVGEHTLTASATDNAGNEGSATRSYTVLAWTLDGFYKPVHQGALNTVKAGSTVPLKFNVYKGETKLTADIGAQFTVNRVGCDTDESVDPLPEEFLTTGGTSLRYDATGGQWVQNWATPARGKGLCYRVTLTTADGSSTSADFRLK